MKEYVTLIVALIGVIISIIAVFNKEQEKGEALQDEYFNLLNIYFELKNVNNSIDPVEFINRYKYKKISIPPYMYYLAKDNERQKLENIMKVDYWINYPNVANNTLRIMEKFSKITYFLAVIFTFIAAMVAMFMTILTIRTLFNFLVSTSIYEFIMYVLAAVLLCGIFIVIPYIFRLITEVLAQEIDEYSSKQKTIEKIINRKLKQYEQKKDKYYFYI